MLSASDTLRLVQTPKRPYQRGDFSAQFSSRQRVHIRYDIGRYLLVRQYVEGRL